MQRRRAAIRSHAGAWEPDTPAYVFSARWEPRPPVGARKKSYFGSHPDKWYPNLGAAILGSVDISPRNRPNWLILKNFLQDACFLITG